MIGVDFPNLGINRAVNDPGESKLYVSTYAATKSEEKKKTSWKVSNLKQPESVTVYLDNNIYSDWSIVDGSTIEINTVIGSKNFCISYRSNSAGKAESSYSSVGVPQETTRFNSESTRNRKTYKPAVPPSCSCC